MVYSLYQNANLLSSPLKWLFTVNTLVFVRCPSTKLRRFTISLLSVSWNPLGHGITAIIRKSKECRKWYFRKESII